MDKTKAALIALGLAMAPMVVCAGGYAQSLAGPERVSEARAAAIEPTVQGLARELSEQGKVLAHVVENQDRDRLALEADIAQIHKNQEALEIKMCQVVDMLRDIRRRGNGQ